ncbi:hypothetical protein BDR26DRAFT_440985 [Obelidium mucronatum]|nr:hypothetical protein BDR26DRAFT_440985 [Obelidium mucronatum]
MSIIHFAGHVKPWDQYRFSDGTVWNRSLSDDTAALHNAWWRIYDDLVKKWMDEDLQQRKVAESSKPQAHRSRRDNAGSSSSTEAGFPVDVSSSNENQDPSQKYYPYYEEKSGGCGGSGGGNTDVRNSSSSDSNRQDVSYQASHSEFHPQHTDNNDHQRMGSVEHPIHNDNRDQQHQHHHHYHEHHSITDHNCDYQQSRVEHYNSNVVSDGGGSRTSHQEHQSSGYRYDPPNHHVSGSEFHQSSVDFVPNSDGQGSNQHRSIYQHQNYQQWQYRNENVSTFDDLLPLHAEHKYIPPIPYYTESNPIQVSHSYDNWYKQSYEPPQQPYSENKDQHDAHRHQNSSFHQHQNDACHHQSSSFNQHHHHSPSSNQVPHQQLSQQQEQFYHDRTSQYQEHQKDHFNHNTTEHNSQSQRYHQHHDQHDSYVGHSLPHKEHHQDRYAPYHQTHQTHYQHQEYHQNHDSQTVEYQQDQQQHEHKRRPPNFQNAVEQDSSSRIHKPENSGSSIANKGGRDLSIKLIPKTDNSQSPRSLANNSQDARKTETGSSSRPSIVTGSVTKELSSSSSCDEDSESQTESSSEDGMVSTPFTDFEDDNEASEIPLEFKTSRYDWNWTEATPPSLNKRSSRSRMNSTVSLTGLTNSGEEMNAFYVVIPKDAEVFDEMFGTTVNSRELARVDKNGIPLALKTRLGKLGEIELVAGNVLMTLMNKSTLCNILSVTSFAGSNKSSRASTPVPSATRRRLSSITPRSSMVDLASLATGLEEIVDSPDKANDISEEAVPKDKKKPKKKSKKSISSKKKRNATEAEIAASVDAVETTVAKESIGEAKTESLSIPAVQTQNPQIEPESVNDCSAEVLSQVDIQTTLPLPTVRKQPSYANVVTKGANVITPPLSPESAKKEPAYSGILVVEPREFPLARYLGGAMEMPIRHTPDASAAKSATIKPEHRHAVQLLTAELKSRTKTIQTLEQKVKSLQCEKQKILEGGNEGGV